MKRSFLIAWLRPALVLALGVATSAAVHANGVLAAHAARYELSLHDAARGSEVAAVKGHLEVRFESSCDGWRLEQSLGFRMLSQDGRALEHLAHLSGFEEHDGTRFTFSTRTWEDRELIDKLAGVVSRNASGDGAVVRYAEPKPGHEPLPRGVLFPSQHVSELVALARSGGRMLMRTVFDGSTRDNPFEVSAWIGEPRSPDGTVPGVLQGHVSWPVRLAYFDVDAMEPNADFEMSVQLYDNGVAGDMIYDYGDFSIDVRLIELTLLPVPECS